MSGWRHPASNLLPLSSRPLRSALVIKQVHARRVRYHRVNIGTLCLPYLLLITYLLVFATNENSSPSLIPDVHFRGSTIGIASRKFLEI